MKTLHYLGLFLLLTPWALADFALPTQELIFADLAVGEGWEVEITLISQGADNSSGTILFFNQDGSEMEVRVDSSTPTSSVDYDLLNRQSITFRITSADGFQRGFALVSQDFTGNTAEGSVGGLLTYRFMESGQTRIQIGVPPAQSLTGLHLPFDNTGPNRTAIAIASLTDNFVTLEWYDELGNFEDSVTLEFEGDDVQNGPDFGEQRAIFLHDEFPGTLGERGFFIIRAEEEIQGLVLNQNVQTLTLSTSAALPAVLERNLVIDLPGDNTQWTLRLIQDTPFLKGFAQQQGGDELETFVSGFFSGSLLQLSLHLTAGDDGLVINLLASSGLNGLTDVTGSAVEVEEDVGQISVGTFTLEDFPESQF